jgi:protein-tyrosine phosphatase
MLAPMSATTLTRTLAVEVAFNVRHLGGYRTRDGRETRPTIVRSASLHRLTDAGVTSLVAHGIRTVVDLRSEKEREEMPTPNMTAHGVTHVFAPVFRTDASPASFADGFVGFGPVYRRFLDTGRDAYRALFEAIALSDGGVLFHCAAGKDRTGVAAALVLELAGVDDGDIVEDYAHSAGLLRDAFRDWKPSAPADAPVIDEATREKLLGSEPAYMAETIEYLRGRWGSARGYLRDLGLDDGTINRARARITW